MTRGVVIVLGILAIIAALTAVASKIYFSGRADERAASTVRAEGMRAEREVLNGKVRNVTTEMRCARNGLDFVPDENGGHCN